MPRVDASAAFLRACALDIETMKPGNVSVASAGHGMTATQFIASADAASRRGLFTPGVRVGARIFDAVRATFDAVFCNTNLGIVLLCAPLCAALELASHDIARWHDATQYVLADLDIDDARLAYRAIALANPGSLGEAPEQSVHATPSVTLREAMMLASERDSIARQYANGFADVFDIALRLDTTREHEAMLDAFLTCLATWPDSHIVRKHGMTMAQSVTHEAVEHVRTGVRRDAPHEPPSSTRGMRI
ncbi:Triphosphoribosyl-dephospho-CoA synthetase [Candidatus Burkholderia humilis]|nr:Triphosphoribosyl-dephospho-CoA synthetase [Candidatus Burkholderia humilis]